jgi:hypothetical protein
MRTPPLGLVVAVAVALLFAIALGFVGGQERVAPATILPDPARTPGVLNPEVTQSTIGSTICVEGWTSRIRPPSSYTTALKREQMTELGRVGSLSDYQEDHFISLGLGGHPTDPRNLWPQPYPRAAEVDRIEVELHDEVCSGELTLAEAQRREAELKHRHG